ncbi:MAG: family 16 glycosylhydrolase [Paracoccaceae bacterium]
MPGWSLGLGLAVIVVAGPVRGAGMDDTSFFDDFTRLDPTRWYISDGWTNGDWQNCLWSTRAVSLSDGFLRLRFAPGVTADHDYICGEIQTRQSFGYGTYEARFRTGAGSGLNAAFFSYIGPRQQKPHDEIDIEVLLKDPAKVSFNTYVSGKPANGRTAVIPPADKDFNSYAFIWEPDRLRWFVNGSLMHEAKGPAGLPLTPQRIFASLWGSETMTDWMGPFKAPQKPVAMEIDWIAFTKSGEPCRFDQSVLCDKN